MKIQTRRTFVVANPPPFHSEAGGEHACSPSPVYDDPEAAAHEFARSIETRAAAIIQINLGRVSGLVEAKRIDGMAEAHHAQIAAPLCCGPVVVGAANIQIATDSPNFPILDSIGRWDGLQAELLKAPIRREAGFVIPPTGRGQ